MWLRFRTTTPLPHPPPKGLNAVTVVLQEGLTRSYSMSAAYIKTMSLDRGNILKLDSRGDQEPGEEI